MMALSNHKAAKQGLTLAQYDLGMMYNKVLDYQEAIKWLNKAASDDIRLLAITTMHLRQNMLHLATLKLDKIST
ncbi:MAG: hypothetical protein ABFS56_31975 [Pseudomonadota bacterium]